MTRAQRPTAVDLDALMAAITPQMAEQFRHRDVAFADQLAAAQRDSVALMERAEGTPAHYVPRGAVDDWLRLGLLDTYLQWVSGDGRTCVHAPDPRRPEVVWSCAWRPGLVVCTHCLPLLRAVGDADKVCDCCGHLCDGLETCDPITTLTVWLGGLAYQAGACRACWPDGDRQQLPPRTEPHP